MSSPTIDDMQGLNADLCLALTAGINHKLDQDRHIRRLTAYARLMESRFTPQEIAALREEAGIRSGDISYAFAIGGA